MTETPPVGTAVGVLGEARVAGVDAAGTVRFGDPSDGGFTLAWWVGAEDRWHRPTDEVSVRYRLVDGAPVSETLTRIPGGDARWRVYGAASAWGPAIVAEASNLSRAPFALALVLHFEAASAMQLRETALERDGRAVLVAARPPGRVSAGDGDRFADVAAGEAVEVAAGAGVVDLGAGATDVVALWPVPHGATLSFVVPLAALPAAGSPPAAAGTAAHVPAGMSTAAGLPPGGLVAAFGTLPTADAVARGWARQLGAVSSFDVGDPAIEAAVRADLAGRLLRAPTSGLAADAVVLDGWGHHDEAAAILDRAARALANGPPSSATAHPPAEWLAAAAAHWRLTGDRAFGGAAADAVLVALRRLGRELDDGAREAAIELLLAGGQAPAARHLAKRRRWPIVRRTTVPAQGGTGGAHERTASPATQARAGLVGEGGDGVLAVWPAWGQGAAGRSVDVRRLPTAWGRLSFAVRWHGPRPALLWEVEPRPDLADGPAPDITMPTVERAWRGHGWQGEALLAVPGAVAASGPETLAEPDGVSFR
jgi:hypothetical protein